MRNGGINETITVRRIFQGVGVGGVSPAFSRIESIKILRRGRCVELSFITLRESVKGYPCQNNGLTAFVIGILN